MQLKRNNYSLKTWNRIYIYIYIYLYIYIHPNRFPPHPPHGCVSHPNFMQERHCAAIPDIVSFCAEWDWGLALLSVARSAVMNPGGVRTLLPSSSVKQLLYYNHIYTITELEEGVFWRLPGVIYGITWHMLEIPYPSIRTLCLVELRSWEKTKNQQYKYPTRI